ncbi:chemotaxis protein CheW [Acidocella aquatica]|uniref:Chemotaxis protein CheW n=1 Tax=Acidocella aquatica TaxID=1922313 RepID=A0ABQ6A335_9PROT|nr:chemotaxis protein CheW [Acidocella aquatica]GLR66206.1 chemotaxis protein CheW [Acidocella aquatica]
MNQIYRTATQPDRRSELLSVRIGAQEFAMDIRSIREIRGWIASTHLPHAPSYIKGMINLRGTVLVVIDLAERLGLPPQEPNAASVVVVVEDGDKTAGLLVDAVCDIITVTDDMRQTTPETGSNGPRQFIEGLIMLDSRIISTISIPAIMPDATALEQIPAVEPV